MLNINSIIKTSTEQYLKDKTADREILKVGYSDELVADELFAKTLSNIIMSVRQNTMLPAEVREALMTSYTKLTPWQVAKLVSKLYRTRQVTNEENGAIADNMVEGTDVITGITSNYFTADFTDKFMQSESSDEAMYFSDMLVDFSGKN